MGSVCLRSELSVTLVQTWFGRQDRLTGSVKTLQSSHSSLITLGNTATCTNTYYIPLLQICIYYMYMYTCMYLVCRALWINCCVKWVLLLCIVERRRYTLRCWVLWIHFTWSKLQTHVLCLCIFPHAKNLLAIIFTVIVIIIPSACTLSLCNKYTRYFPNTIQ